MKEKWKQFHKDYSISNYGILKRVTSARGTFVGKLIKGAVDSHGYRQVRIDSILVFVHHLVLLNYVGSRLNKNIGNHKDGNKLNNYEKNLEWTTYSGNAEHAVANGLWWWKDEKHPATTLTWEDIFTIRGLYETGDFTQKEIAYAYNISCVKHILYNLVWYDSAYSYKGKTWKRKKIKT